MDLISNTELDQINGHYIHLLSVIYRPEQQEYLRIMQIALDKMMTNLYHAELEMGKEPENVQILLTGSKIEGLEVFTHVSDEDGMICFEKELTVHNLYPTDQCGFFYVKLEAKESAPFFHASKFVATIRENYKRGKNLLFVSDKMEADPTGSSPAVTLLNVKAMPDLVTTELGKKYCTNITKDILKNPSSYKTGERQSLYEAAKTLNSVFRGKHEDSEAGIASEKDEESQNIYNALKKSKLDQDHVPALHVHGWPSEAVEWLLRRHRLWPNKEVIYNIFLLGFHVVPKAPPGGEDSDYSWRLSFSRAELELSRHMTVIQKQCYAIVKSTFYNELQFPKVLSSYCVKTLFLWSLEKTPQHKWNVSSVAERVLSLYDDLLMCLAEAKLPHYFMPQINLLEHFSPDQIDTVTNQLLVIRKNPLHYPFKTFSEAVKSVKSVLFTVIGTHSVYSKPKDPSTQAELDTFLY